MATINTTGGVILTAASLFIATLCGCSGKASYRPGDALRDYYPMEAGSHRRIEWQNARGDRWSGAIAVVASTDAKRGQEFTVVDTTYSAGAIEVSQSGYLWDSAGLKHLFRVTNSNRDSLTFSPPRLVLPSKFDENQMVENTYRQTLYGADGKIKFTGRVTQKFKLTGMVPVEMEGSEPINCLQVEINIIHKSESGTEKHQLRRMWLLKDFGPVKFEITEPAPDGGWTTTETGVVKISG